MIEDLAQLESLNRIINEIQMMIKRTIPIRFGTVFMVKDKYSTCKFVLYASQ